MEQLVFLMFMLVFVDLYLHSEKKIEVIEGRLAHIETLLENLTSLSAAIPARMLATPSMSLQSSSSPSKAQLIPPPSTHPSISSAAASSTSLSRARRDAKPNAAFEGDSSLRAHSVHASRVIENAMNSDTGFGPNPEMQDALVALRNLIEKQHSGSVNQDYRFAAPQHGDASTVDILSVKMPAMESVVGMLRICKGKSETIR
jgi:hypothetical protein